MKRWLITAIWGLAGLMAGCSNTPGKPIDRETEQTLRWNANQTNVIFVGEISKIEEPLGFWSGYITVAQGVTYQVVEILKKPRDMNLSAEIQIPYLIVMTNPLCDKNKAALSAEIFRPGNRVLVFARYADRRYQPSESEGRSVFLYSEALKAQTLKLIADREGWGETKNGLRCRVICNKPSYKMHEPIIVNFQVSNVSDKTQSLSAHLGYITDLGTYASLRFSMRDQNGRELAGNWSISKDNMARQIELSAGQTLDLFTTYLGRWYKFPGPGEYTFQVSCIYDHLGKPESIQAASNPLKIVLKAE